MKTVYATKASVTGGRNGKIVSEDGVLNLEVRLPKELGGTGGEFTNPEQLFAAGYSACFDSALNLVASIAKLKIESTINTTVCLLAGDNNDFKLAIQIDAEINNIDKATALELLKKAHAVCPYSKAISNNVEVSVNLI